MRHFWIFHESLQLMSVTLLVTRGEPLASQNSSVEGKEGTNWKRLENTLPPPLDLSDDKVLIMCIFLPLLSAFLIAKMTTQCVIISFLRYSNRNSLPICLRSGQRKMTSINNKLKNRKPSTCFPPCPTSRKLPILCIWRQWPSQHHKKILVLHFEKVKPDPTVTIPESKNNNGISLWIYHPNGIFLIAITKSFVGPNESSTSANNICKKLEAWAKQHLQAWH